MSNVFEVPVVGLAHNITTLKAAKNIPRQPEVKSLVAITLMPKVLFIKFILCTTLIGHFDVMKNLS